MPRTDVLPTYTNDLAGFAGILRVSVFSSQRRAADYFHLNRSTIVRYENEDLKPPLGYLTCLARLVIDKQKGSEQDRQNLLVQLNRAIRHNYDYEVPFQTWPELDAVADAYLVERGQKTDATASLPRPHSPTDPASPSPPLPAETPALPVFYTERPDEQSKLLDYIAIKHVPALVLWGAGGVGKSVLMAWLAAHVSEKFPDGQIWVELPDNVSPPTAVSEAQVHIARSLGVMLPGISPAEKAGQLRTLLAGKRCLLMVDNLNFATDLSYLHVTGLTGCFLVTTRYRKVADVLEAPLLSIKGMTPAEGLDLLVRWANYTVDSGESMHDFVERLGGLPLALKLCGARLREGESVAQLRTDFDQDNIDLGQFDLDDPQTPHDGLIRCFERSLSNLTESECQGFIQLGCFIGHFEVGAAAAVWHLSLSDSRRRLRRLHGLALLRRKANAYQLHPLLRDYARQKMAELPILKQNTYQRYAAYFIRHTLYHPELLADESLPPNLDHRWVDVVAAVQWAAAYDAELASTAALLAYGDRPALLEALGPTLPHTVEEYASTSETVYQGVWYELLGDLYLINNHYESAAAAFRQADKWGHSGQHYFACSRARLRLAGIHIIRNQPHAALTLLQQAQTALTQGLPLSESEQATASRLFYWFDLMCYSMMHQWPGLLPEAEIKQLVALAQSTQQPLLEARAWHIYRLWCTVGLQPEPIKKQGRQFGARAAWLWWRHGQPDKALAEVMWTQEYTRGRRSPRLARHFAQRRAQGTPILSQNQIQLIDNEKWRRWLAADEGERVAWLIDTMPDPNSDDWQAVDDLLALGILGQGVRRLAEGSLPPSGWNVGQAVWRALTGQKVLPLADPIAIALVMHSLERLDTIISD